MLLVCVLSAFLARSAFAVTPLEYTKQTLDQTGAIVASDRSQNDKLAALSNVLKNFLDTDTMGKAALDQHWEKFTPPQQTEFLNLFRDLFQRSYVQKLLLFEKPEFGYSGETRNADGSARVDTKIITARDEFAIVYELRPDHERWLATDIRIEDLSLTANFRRQMDRLLWKSSPEELLSRMRRKYGPEGHGPEGHGPEGHGGQGPDGQGPDGQGPEGHGPAGQGGEDEL